MNDRPLLIQSLPNSGSTWFAALVARNLPGARYCMEFFNPLRNLRFRARLEQRWGCELVGCYQHIAAPDDPSLDDDIAACWFGSGYTMTKEVFAPRRLATFARHFQCVVFIRSWANSFPASRLRVWSFYEHAWHSLALHGFPVTAQRLDDRCEEAHRLLTASLIADAALCGVPVVTWESLFEGPRVVQDTLRAALGWCSDGLADEIAATAVNPRARP